MAALSFVVSTAAIPVPAASAAGDGTALDQVATAMAAARDRSYDITLVTGDTVHVRVTPNGGYETRVELAPRPAGQDVTTTTLVGGGHAYVLPSDAAGLVASGRLDMALFDVRQLIADGYTDERSDRLPVIVQYASTSALDAGSRAKLRERSEALPASAPVRTLESIDGASLSVAKSRAERFWSSVTVPRSGTGTMAYDDGVTRLWLDGRVRASLDQSVPMIGAPEAWAAGYDGTGVKVAILDTGIDAAHQDLAGQIAAERSFVPGVNSVADGNGHGTHVASTVAGTGAASSGRYRGVAPGAKLVIGKVLSDGGSGSESWIIDGMEWAAETEDAPIVSMSLGTGAASDGTDPMSQAVDELTASTGALFVIAAGNEGSGARTVSSPGAADAAFTVAAVDKSDRLAGFSSRGPRISDYALKPDIAAPGVDITAARAAGTALGPIVDDEYTTISGTSMATPHVAGAAALLLQQHPGWTEAQLKGALASTSKDDGYTVYQQGAGRVDVGHAVQAQVLAETEKVDFARLRWPHTGPPVTRTVTYRNDGDQPITLSLSADVRTQSGAAAASGMFTVSPSTLDVPAGGTVDATVTVDPTLGNVGLYSGVLTATADGVTLRTPIGAYKEPEGFELSVRTIQRDGAVLGVFGSLIVRRVDTDDGQWTVLPASGSTSVHLENGVYSVAQTAAWADRPGDLNNEAFLVAPEVRLDRDTSITLDANQAVRLDPQTDTPTEILGATLSDWRIPAGSETPYGVVTSQLPYQVKTWATPTPDVTVGRFLFEHNHLAGTPVITAEVPGQGPRPAVRLSPRYQHYSVNVPKLDGRTDLPIVDVGTGSDADFAGVDVHGKAALINVGDKGLAPILGLDFAREELTNAAGAGAAAVLAYGNAGVPRLGFVAMPHSVYPDVPTVALPADEGETLHQRLAEGPATVRVDSEPTIPDVYSLSYLEQGSIPATPNASVSDDELATLRPTVHGDRPVSIEQSWSPTWPWIFQPDGLSTAYAALSLIDTPGPMTRTEHVGPVSSGAIWSRSAFTYDLERMLELDSGHVVAVTLGGTFGQEVIDHAFTRREDWSESPTVPGMLLMDDTTLDKLTPDDRPPCAACRYSGLLPGGDLLPLLTLSTDAAGHYGELTSYANPSDFHPDSTGVDEWHLFADGTELPQQSLLGVPGVLPYYVVPAESKEYELTEHFVDGYPRGGYGTRADTTWTFQSQAPSGKEVPETYDPIGLCAVGCGALPLIFLSYDLDLRADNRLEAPGEHAITVTAYRQPTSASMPALSGLTMQASFDGGAHWRSVPATPLGDGRYRVVLTHPKLSATSGTVSLKTEVWDAAGNRVEQVLRDAYGLDDRD